MGDTFYRLKWLVISLVDSDALSGGTMGTEWAGSNVAVQAFRLGSLRLMFVPRK